MLALACQLWSVSGQGALQLGGQPPQAVTMELCSISDVFGRLNTITSDENCRSGCAGGTGDCAAMWMPSAVDECLPDCGRVFEPFWDQCERAVALCCTLYGQPPLTRVHGAQVGACSQWPIWVAWRR